MNSQEGLKTSKRQLRAGRSKDSIQGTKRNRQNVPIQRQHKGQRHAIFSSIPNKMRNMWSRVYW